MNLSGRLPLRPFTVLQNFRQANPELASGITLRQVANLIESLRRPHRLGYIEKAIAHIRKQNGCGANQSLSVPNVHVLDEDVPYFFGDQLDVGDIPKRGLLIGVTCRRLISLLRTVPDPVVLHIDSTHNCNHNQFPVVLVGVSDRMNRLHLVAAFVTCNETAADYRAIFDLLLDQVRVVTRAKVKDRIRFVMSDAADAIWSAVASRLDKATHLMCWFHVRQEYFTYFVKEWVDSHSAWQVFHTDEFLRECELLISEQKLTIAMYGESLVINDPINMDTPGYRSLTRKC